jgi:cell wall-associated NlpC family hydrolase
MTTVSSIQGWIANLQNSMDNLPTEIEQDGASGNFAGVLADIQQLMAPAASSTTATGTTTSADSTSTDSATTPVTGDQVVSEAAQFLGTPYVWGGATPATGFDCSGLVQYVYGQLGINLPRTSEEQATVGTPVASLADAQPGDLVFFAAHLVTSASTSATDR